ncbi:hypothetical protein AB0C18_00545 [Nonomuraea muscovyensis]|uniref:McrC family protein n=1 Tax=Nonomuraea muscovyensis TaxID=1124761 RepID=UPI0033C09E6D
MTKRTSPPRIDLTEGGDWSTWTLTGPQIDTLRAFDKLLDLRPSGRASDGRQRFRLKAKRTIGAARLGLGDGVVQLRIAPKVPVDRLLYLLTYTPDRADWKSEQIDAAIRPELFPAIAIGFVRTAEQALVPGLLTGYRHREATSMTLRGRLRVSSQLRTRPGLALPLEIAYTEHTPDVSENQLLLGAIRRLCRLPGLTPPILSRLRRLDAALEDITAPAPGAPIPVWTPTRLNRRYVPALRLAEIVLRGASFEYTDGRPIRVDGLLINMEKVFEEFLAKALGALLERQLGGRAKPQSRNHFLDDKRQLRLKPDLVHWLPNLTGTPCPAIVVDAKYQHGLERANLYQMLAYCTRLGLTEGHLVSVAGTAGDPTYIPTASGPIVLHHHVLDLSLSRQALTIRLSDLAQAIIQARQTPL